MHSRKRDPLEIGRQILDLFPEDSAIISAHDLKRKASKNGFSYRTLYKYLAMLEHSNLIYKPSVQKGKAVFYRRVEHDSTQVHARMNLLKLSRPRFLKQDEQLFQEALGLYGGFLIGLASIISHASHLSDEQRAKQQARNGVMYNLDTLELVVSYCMDARKRKFSNGLTLFDYIRTALRETSIPSRKEIERILLGK